MPTTPAQEQSREALKDVQFDMWAMARELRARAEELSDFADQLTPLLPNGVSGNTVFVYNVAVALEKALRTTQLVSHIPPIVNAAQHAVR